MFVISLHAAGAVNLVAALRRVSARASTQAQHQVQHCVFLNVVVLQGVAILELFPRCDEPLLFRRYAFLAVDLVLHLLNSIGGLNVEGECFPVGVLTKTCMGQEVVGFTSSLACARPLSTSDCPTAGPSGHYLQRGALRPCNFQSLASEVPREVSRSHLWLKEAGPESKNEPRQMWELAM